MVALRLHTIASPPSVARAAAAIVLQCGCRDHSAVLGRVDRRKENCSRAGKVPPEARRALGNVVRITLTGDKLLERDRRKSFLRLSDSAGLSESDREGDCGPLECDHADRVELLGECDDFSVIVIAGADRSTY